MSRLAALLTIAAVSLFGNPAAAEDAHSKIQIVFKIHIEPTSSNGAPPLAQRSSVYEKRRDEVSHIAAIASEYGAKLSIHANGEFFEYVAEKGDQAVVEGWLAAGNHLGLHMHNVQRFGQHDWRPVPGISGETAADSLWKSHVDLARAAFPSRTFIGATPFDAHQSWSRTLLGRYGFSIMGSGPDEVAVSLIGHRVWNPFRYAPGTTLGEDLTAPAVLVPHPPQIGEADPHGPQPGVFQDNRSSYLKVEALQVYLERSLAIANGDPSRVWVFGLLHHDNKGSAEADRQIRDVLDFVKRWLVDRNGSDGKPAGVFASFDDVAQRFAAWETANPGRSSFRWDGATYPYRLAGLASRLQATREREVILDGELASPDAQGTYVIRLRIGPRGGLLQPAWLVWREDGASGSVNLSADATAAGAVGPYDAVDGISGRRGGIGTGWIVTTSETPFLVVESSGLDADFAWTPVAPVAGQEVQFTASSSATSFQWSFGDGATSTARDPLHRYDLSGTFNVSLTASDSSGSVTETKSLTVARGRSRPVRPSTPSDLRVSFSINVHDFLHPRESAALVNRIIDLHERLNVPVDIFLTTAMIDLYEQNDRDLLARLASSPVVSVSYHVRPPSPYAYDFDWLGISSMSREEQKRIIRDYETHGLDLTTGRTTAEAGSYAKLTSLMGYPPPVAGSITNPEIAPAACAVYSELGAQFLIAHGRVANEGDELYGMRLKPEHLELRLFEHRGEDGGALLDDGVIAVPTLPGARAPYFVVAKVHDHEFISTKSAWRAV